MNRHKFFRAFLFIAALATGAAFNTSLSFSVGAIFVSEQGNVGWSTNYENFREARKSASVYCLKDGNSNCELALDCPSGWAAIAYGKTSGYGMMCGGPDRVISVYWALAGCIRAVKAKCYTLDAFHEGGNTVSKGDDHAMDNVIYAQVLLTKLGYYHDAIDGDFGPSTKVALTRFQQTRSDLAASGIADDETVKALIEAGGGEASLASFVIAITDDKIDPRLGIKISAGPAQTAPTDKTAAPSPAESVTPSPQLKTLEALKAKITKGFEQAFGDTGDFQTPSPLECLAAGGKFPDSCSMKAMDSKRSAEVTLNVELFASSYHSSALAQGQSTESVNINDRIMAEASGAGSVLKWTQGFSRSNADGSNARALDNACYQYLGAKASEAICYLALDDRVVLSVFVPAVDADHTEMKLEKNTSPTADIDRGDDLLLHSLAGMADLDFSTR